MKNMLTKFLTLILLFGAFNGFAQYENLSGSKQSSHTKKQKAPFLSRLSLGGNIGGSWSSTAAYFEISPTVSYLVTDNFHVGTRLTYIYSSYEYYHNERYSYHDYGASIFSRYHLFRFLFLHAEFEELNIQYYPSGIADGKNRKWISSLFLGGGIYQQMGRTFMHVTLLYNVLENEYSPYVNPMIRIGFGVGL